MSAAARAEARRKAILARGGDRLAKLTSSARGEEAPAYMHDDPPLAPLPNRPNLESFVGERTELPSSPSSSRNVGRSSSAPFQAAGLGTSVPDPSVWSEEQQRQFLNALLGGGLAPPPVSNNQPRLPPSSGSSAPPSEDEPLAALMSSMTQFSDANGSSLMDSTTSAASSQKLADAKPKTFLQKVLPLVHLLVAWALLAYFVFWKEPESYDLRTHGAVLSDTRWTRWAELAWKFPEQGWGVQAVPFFWAFTTSILVLHSWRVFSRLDTIQTPMLLAFALPHLPPPLPSIITNGMKYLQIGGIFLDDLAALLVGLGFLVWIAGWLAT
ncbi:hypothetical protein BKA93DRAFT_902562 [Sparassis latifolia]|uniref:Uncharacterized protein n=1 Tax=Sparassis crispa TaxID=139825 RepID=A0A401G8U4_9APHY|nr:hypothetical protein SCP_0114670 [Sparassis crispa]GBE78578.1 hypothetical protein SCP_0114670 [Sparassis crispa]